MGHLEIEIHYADRRTETRQLGEGQWSIGREAGDIVLGDAEVSSRHAVLQVQGTQVTFTDQGSTNGSFAEDGTRLNAPVTLGAGSQVRMGGCLIVVKAAPAAAPPPSPVSPKGTMIMNPGLVTPPAPSGARPPAPASQPAPAQPAPAPAAAAQAQAAPAPAAPAPAAPAQPAYAAVGPADAGRGEAQAQPGGQGIWDQIDNEEASAEPALLAAAQTYGYSEPVGQAGQGMTDFFGELKRRIRETWALYVPHGKPLGMIVAAVTVPAALLYLVLGLVPVVSLLTIPIAMLESMAMFLFVSGMIADYALCIHLGRPTSPAEVLQRQMKRLLPWALTMMITGILSFIGFFLLVLPAIMVGWAAVPAFLVEGKQMHEASLRSFELFKADWLHVLQALAIPLVAVALPAYLAMAILESLPVLGWLGPLYEAVASALLIPFMSLYGMRLYFETRRRVEGGDPESQASSASA